MSGFAILGAGIFPALAYLPALATLLQKQANVSPPLKAIYSRSQHSAADLASKAQTHGLGSPDVYYGDQLDKLLQRNDITAVLIALPITVQPEIILRCLAAGKHVLSEKPVAPTIDAGLKLIKDASQYVGDGKVIWRVAENWEAESVYRTTGDVIRSGRIGEVKSFKASVVNYIDEKSPWYNTPWRTHPEYQGGFILDGGVHTTAALRTLLPANLTHLSGFASLNKKYLEPHDTIHTIVRSESSIPFNGTVDMTWAWPTKSKPQQEELIVSGSVGWLGISRTEQGDWRLRIRWLVDEKTLEEKEEVFTFPSDGVVNEFAQFFHTIASETSWDIGRPCEALKDVAFVQAALESKGNIVELLK